MSRRVWRIREKFGELRLSKTINISHWIDLGPESVGTRAKRVLRHPNTGALYLAKFPRLGRLEIAVEVFNGILAAEIDINHVRYFPIIFGDKEGVVCKSFIDRAVRGEELWEMKELVCRHSGDASLPQKKFGRDEDVLREHNIVSIFLALESEFGESVLRPFFEMVGFDALVGHPDRHWQNYGIIVSADLDGRFSPVYDTASGYLLGHKDEAVIKTYKTDLLNDEWYRPTNMKGNSKITVPENIKCNHFDLMEHILSNSSMEKYRHSLGKAFRNFDPRLPRTIIRKFLPNLPKLRADIMERILLKRYALGRKILSR
jgi:hypothetical protein